MIVINLHFVCQSFLQKIWEIFSSSFVGLQKTSWRLLQKV